MGSGSTSPHSLSAHRAPSLKHAQPLPWSGLTQLLPLLSKDRCICLLSHLFHMEGSYARHQCQQFPCGPCRPRWKSPAILGRKGLLAKASSVTHHTTSWAGLLRKLHLAGQFMLHVSHVQHVLLVARFSVWSLGTDDGF